MYTINKTSQAIIGEVLGKDYNEIVNMDYDEEIQYIQKINHNHVSWILTKCVQELVSQGKTKQ